MALEKDQRYLGGGRLYFEKKVNGVLSAKKEIGDVKEFKITTAIETIEAESESGSTPEVVDEVVTKATYTISFSTMQVDKDTLVLALLGTLGTKQYSSGDTLPDGSTASAATTYTTIDPTQDLVEGRVTFVSSPKRGKKRVVIFHNVNLKFNADLLLQSKEFVTIPFEGKVLRDDSVTEGSAFFRIYEEQ